MIPSPLLLIYGTPHPLPAPWSFPPLDLSLPLLLCNPSQHKTCSIERFYSNWIACNSFPQATARAWITMSRVKTGHVKHLAHLVGETLAPLNNISSQCLENRICDTIWEHEQLRFHGIFISFIYFWLLPWNINISSYRSYICFTFMLCFFLWKLCVADTHVHHFSLGWTCNNSVP